MVGQAFRPDSRSDERRKPWVDERKESYLAAPFDFAQGRLRPARSVSGARKKESLLLRFVRLGGLRAGRRQSGRGLLIPLPRAYALG